MKDKPELTAIDILLADSGQKSSRNQQKNGNLVVLYSLVDASRAIKLRTFCCSTTNRGGILR